MQISLSHWLSQQSAGVGVTSVTDCQELLIWAPRCGALHSVDLEQLARQECRQCYCRDLLYRGQSQQSYIATHTATRVGVNLRSHSLVRSRAGCRLTFIDFKNTINYDLAHFLT